MGVMLSTKLAILKKVVSKFSHLKIKDVNTPFDSSVQLEKNDDKVVAQLEYSSAIGSLMDANTPFDSSVKL